jgi:hypothetical protein
MGNIFTFSKIPGNLHKFRVFVSELAASLANVDSVIVLFGNRVPVKLDLDTVSLSLIGLDGTQLMPLSIHTGFNPSLQNDRFSAVFSELPHVHPKRIKGIVVEYMTKEISESAERAIYSAPLSSRFEILGFVPTGRGPEKFEWTDIDFTKDRTRLSMQTTIR